MGETKMIAIALETLRGKATTQYNLHLRLSENKYVLWLRAGSPLSADALDRLQAKGVAELFLALDDYRSFVAGHISNATQLVDSLHVPQKLKLTSLHQATSAVLQEIESLGFTREIFIHAKLSTEVVTVLAEAHPEFEAFVTQMGNQDSNLVNHALATSILSVMVGTQLGWGAHQTLEKLALGGFLHDIGLLKLPKDVQDKPVNRLKHDDLILYQGHCELGRQMLMNLSFIPEDVSAIVYQHHELSTGKGYPNHSKDAQINPLSRVVAAVNEFCELTLPNPQQVPQRTPGEAIVHMEVALGQPFNKDVFAALKKLTGLHRKASA